MKFDKQGFKEDLMNLLDLYFPDLDDKKLERLVTKILFFVCKHLRLTQLNIAIAETNEEEDDA